jgi:hypothetical protein
VMLCMTPLLNMWNPLIMMKNCSFPCIACYDDNDACVVTTLSNNCSFPRFVDNKDKLLNMFCA